MRPAARSWARVWLPLMALAAIYAASRVCLLAGGYGSDDDAWLVARAADRIAAEGRYVPSRLPGYPTVDLTVAAAFALFGPGYVTGNAAAAAVGLVGVLLFVAVARRLRLAMAHGAALALAFQPAYWISSVTTIDSVWSATFTLAALERLLVGAPTVAGIAIGLATGARLTNVILVAPAAAWLWMTRRRLAPILSLLAATGATSLLLFAPLLRAHGFGFLQLSSPIRLDYLAGLYWVVQRLIGLPVILVAIAALCLSCRRASLPALLRGACRPESVLLGGSIAVLFAQWLAVPYDPFHLLPWVPLMLLLVLRWVPRRPAQALMVACVIPSLVSIAALDVSRFRESHAFVVDAIGPGQVLTDYRQREAMLDTAKLLAAHQMPAGSCLVVGPSIWAFQHELGLAPRLWRDRFVREGNDVLFLRILRPEWQRETVGTRPIYYLAGQDLPYLTGRIFGTSLDSLGARELTLPSPAARGSKP